jgi:hypothetical protein
MSHLQGRPVSTHENVSTYPFLPASVLHIEVNGDAI